MADFELPGSMYESYQISWTYSWTKNLKKAPGIDDKIRTSVKPEPTHTYVRIQTQSNEIPNYSSLLVPN